MGCKFEDLDYNHIIIKVMHTQFSISKALEFVGDNSNYQKIQLTYLGIIITAFATLNCQIPLINPGLGVQFLFFSGLGQFVCPVYMSLKTICLGILGSIGFTFIFYPVWQFMFGIGLCAVGFFGRGFYISSLIYLNQIGGDRFRAWSTIVLLGFWAIAPLLLGVEKLMKMADILWLFLFVLIPFMIGGVLVLNHWKPSPLSLYTKRNFTEAKQVLNQMAKYNKRNELPYGLEGESDQDLLSQYKKITYKDMLSNSFILNLTIPLAALWIYRQYIYYSSYIIVPELGNQQTKNLILLSVSQIAAILMSYPIKLKIKRKNAFFLFVCVIAVCSLLSSFTRLDQECKKVGNSCFSKYLYRISIMLIRFSISLIGSILVNYTLEVYPSDVIRPGFSLCLGLSAIGSAFMPWLVETFIYINLSGFISFSFFSILILYFILQLQQTNGYMNTSTLNQLETGQAMVSLQGWAKLRFT